MTLNTELPMISIEHKIQQIQHHYHVQHLFHSTHNRHHRSHIQTTNLQHNNNHYTSHNYNNHQHNLPQQLQQHQQEHQRVITQPTQILPQQQQQNHQHFGLTQIHDLSLNHNNHNQQNNHSSQPQLTNTTRSRSTSPTVAGKNVVDVDKKQHQHSTSNGHTKSTIDQESSAQKKQIQFIVLAAFAYVMSPIDLIPEAIFGVFGLLDDIIFLFMCMFCIAIILLYPIMRNMRHTIFDKLGLITIQPSKTNKTF